MSRASFPRVDSATAPDYDGGGMKEILKSLRISFVAGLLVVVPVAASVLLLLGVFNWVTDFLLPQALHAREGSFIYRIIALLVFVLFVTAVGWATRLVVGRRLVALTESLVRRVPLLNRIYSFIKEISQTMLTGQKTMFQRVVLVPHPRPGMYAVGLVTAEAAPEASGKTNSDLMHVFVPASPPMHGFLLLVPRDQVINLDMSVADGMKMLLSGGAVVPMGDAKTVPAAPSPANVSLST